MPISGDIDSGYVLGNPTYNGQFCMVGEDGKHYIAWRKGGVFPNPPPYVLIAQFESGLTSATAIDFTQFNADLVSLGGPDGMGLPYGGFFVTTQTPVKGTSLMWVLGTSDINNAATQFPVVGVLYRIDGPDTFTPIHYLHMICSVMDKSPSIARDLHCAAVLNNQVYACVVCGEINLFTDTINTRLIGPLPINADVVDLGASSWDEFSVALPFAETLSGIGNADLLQGTNMAITEGNGGIAVFWPRSSSDLPFTVVAPDGSNTGETNMASAFGMPFADEGLNWQGVASGNASDTYWRAPNIEGRHGTEICFDRGFTDSGTEGYRQMRIKRFSWDSATNTPAYVDQTDFQYRVPTDLTFTPRYGVTSREGADLNVAMGYIGEFWRSGFTTLAPITGPVIVPPETNPMPEPIFLVDRGREPTLRQRLVNMYSEPTPKGPSKFSRYQRPGLYDVAERGSGPIRASFLWNGYRFTVSGFSVYRDSTLIGTVTGTGLVRFAFSDDEVVIVSGGKAWYVTLTSIAHITDSDLPVGVIDVAFLAGRFVYVVDGTARYYYSALNDARTIEGTSFATAAENTADHLVGVAVLVDQLVFFTTKVIEWWVPQDDPDAPYRRSPGRKNDQGLASRDTLVLCDNSLFFLGYDKMIYRSAAVPVRISNFEVEDWLRRVSIEDLEAAYAFQVIVGGHTFYVIFIPDGGSWAYDVSSKEWVEWKSWGKDRFRVYCADENFLGDYYTGTIMGFDGKVFTDLDDDPIERIVSAWLPLRTGAINNFMVCLNCTRGVGLPTGYGSDPVVEMRYSDDEGATWSNWLESTLGMEGDRTNQAKAIWTQLGMITAPGRAFEFRCSDPVAFSPYQMIFNEAHA